MDELPEFNRNTLEVLRGPIEDGNVVIGRMSQVLSFPCRFMLVASMNPCPCGYWGSEKECKCSETSIKKYLSKISGPLLDRMDIQVEVNPVKYENIAIKGDEEKSEEIRKRVNKARLIQQERYRNLNINFNAELTPKLINEFCQLNSESRKIMQQSFRNTGMTARAYDRILKVARTIADLDGSKNIDSKHVLEAIQYRSLDRKINKIVGGVKE